MSMMSKINKKWHEAHIMPNNASFEQRVKWHIAHSRYCACRPMPAKLAEEMKKKGVKF